MRPSISLLAALSAASLLALPAAAQSYSGPTDPGLRDGAQALFFLRIPFGEPDREAQPRFGFGVFSGCPGFQGLTSEAGRDACDAHPLRSFELSSGFSEFDWTLSLSGARRRTEIASWSPTTGRLSLAGEDTGAGNWLWIGLGAVATVGLVTALSADDDATLCPDGFVSTPLTSCQPIS